MTSFSQLNKQTLLRHLITMFLVVVLAIQTTSFTYAYAQDDQPNPVSPSAGSNHNAQANPANPATNPVMEGVVPNSQGGNTTVNVVATPSPLTGVTPPSAIVIPLFIVTAIKFIAINMLKGYISAKTEEHMYNLYGVRLVVEKRSNMKPNYKSDNDSIKTNRKRIETLFSQFEKMGLQRIQVRTLKGLFIKVHAAILSTLFAFAVQTSN
jgi:hypothetical protein